MRSWICWSWHVGRVADLACGARRRISGNRDRRDAASVGVGRRTEVGRAAARHGPGW
ncbi:hypothetical protein ACQP0I_15300 [Micromonospora carbonacea]|uniref:hypothetical protein n=1 Tax=Micromonospora carbonacea TaxID=47853 RepID=UPI003D972A07